MAGSNDARDIRSDVRGQIREFLSTRRARISPKQAGLPVYLGDRRRVSGLRREEVALLAGISSEYYTRLERGNATGVSGSVIDGIAHALQLDEAERAHLLDLLRIANVRWGKRGARINAISPGIIITPLARDELTGPRGEGYRDMLSRSPAGRAGTPDEVATVGAATVSRSSTGAISGAYRSGETSAKSATPLTVPVSGKQTGPRKHREPRGRCGWLLPRPRQSGPCRSAARLIVV
jgi:NAD(P)-dependent dehydrogenase (short-subunit alcohol dehydrogenase family)